MIVMKFLKTVQGKMTSMKSKAIAGAVATTAVATQVAGYCDLDDGSSGNQAIQKTLHLIFNVLFIGGIIMIIAGVISLVRTILSIAGGDQSQPGAIIKGAALVISGAIMMLSKTIIEAVTGKSIDSLTLV